MGLIFGLRQLEKIKVEFDLFLARNWSQRMTMLIRPPW